MDVKGSTLVAAREFIKLNFGETGLKKWVASLPEEAQSVFSSAIISANWYSMNEYLVEPTKRACAMFYNGDLKGAWEMGRHSADYGLKGIYRFFVQLANPQFIIKKADRILPTYYRPSEIRATQTGAKSTKVEILEFSEISPVIENRIGGWIEKALEISGCKNVSVKIIKFTDNKDGKTSYEIAWD